MKNIINTFFIIVSLNVNSQQLAYGNEIEAIEICRQLSYSSTSEPLDEDIDNVLDQIISITGLEKNFQLQICSNIDNASALSFNGVRYIFYDKDFLESISGKNRWFVTFILAHEVAHHLQDHTKDALMYYNGYKDNMSKEKRRLQELEADKWAGFILGKLGCSFKNAIDAVSKIPYDEYEDHLSDHPHEALRIEAVTEGYNNAVGGIQGLQFDKYQGYNTGKYLISFYDGIEKLKSKDYSGALKDFNKVIIDKKEFPEPYINRAIIKEKNGDLYGAISDIELAMKWNPDLDILYNERGFYKEKLNLFQSALEDYDLAISMNESSLSAYFNRAVLNWNILSRNFRSNIPTNLYKILDDLNKCISIYPNYLEARYYRAVVIMYGYSNGLTDHLINIAIEDTDISLSYSEDYIFTTPVSLDKFTLDNLFIRSALNLNLKNYSSVLSDSNRIIDNSKNNLDIEMFQELFIKGNMLKLNVIGNENSPYYDAYDLCKFLESYISLIEPHMQNFINNQVILSGIKHLNNAYYDNDCLSVW